MTRERALHAGRPDRARGGAAFARAALFRAVLALAALAASAPLLAPPRIAAAQPSVGDTPSWVALRAAWRRAADTRHESRWHGSLETMVAAERRVATAESLYRASLLAWTPGPSALRVAPDILREAALDLVAWGAPDRAASLLEGPLRDDELLLPLRAAALGRTGGASAGLALLGWPPDRRLARGDRWRAGMTSAVRGDTRDVAHLLTAAALCDSAGDARGARAAWRAILSAAAAPSAGPAARDLARLRLARRLLAEGTPRLAAALLDPPPSGAHALLRGEAIAASGDTLGALGALIEYGARSRAPVSERYPALRLAADWARRYADRLAEAAHADLCRALGEVGEADRAIPLLRARTAPPSGAEAELARAELDASLLARARRFTEAIAAYRALGSRPSLPEGAPARIAIALARASRGDRAFAVMDSAFVAAARLDREGSIADRAAWERAREWEDAREAREAAAIFSWADSAIRSPDLKAVARVHEALSWKRAGRPDSARAAVAAAPASDPIGIFWRARFALEAGDTTAALRDFAAAHRVAPVSYEGIRAREESARIGRPIPVAEPTEAAPAEGDHASRIALDEAALEMRLLEALGWNETAADRRRRCARESDAARARACMDALEDAGVFRVGRRSLVPEARFDYPPAYPSEVMSAAAAESLPPALLWAIMRQESAYDRQARSKAGALGLLQLLPSTASQVAGRPIPPDSLTSAALNVRLGARYVKRLLREFGDPRAVLASYNAGEDAVRRWNRDRGAVDDEWVERIPYRETRDYVKQVYLGWRMYEAIYRVRDGAAGATPGGERRTKGNDGAAPAP